MSENSESEFQRRPTMGRYILNGHTPVLCEDLLTWARWFETADRRVARDVVGDYEISTVFIGLDHRFSGGGRPILFETMTFSGFGRKGEQLEQRRYCTWDEAEAGHKEIVAKVRQAVNS